MEMAESTPVVHKARQRRRELGVGAAGRAARVRAKSHIWSL